MKPSFFVYLVVMAGVTYLVRMLPLVLVKKKIKNRYLISFLHYIPYAVLSCMTIPACFYATGSIISAAAGVIAAFWLAYRGKGLLVVASVACLCVFLTNAVMTYIPTLIK